MAVTASPPESRILIDEVTLRSFHPKAARVNLDNIEIEAPRMILTFEVEVDRVAGEMNRLTRIFRKRNAVKLSLDFVEQLELRKNLEEVDPRARLTDPLGTMPAAARNGEHAVDDSPPQHIGEAIKKSKREKARTGGHE
jgi:hypothetical protein